MSKTHELKITPNFLTDILVHGKTFEIRFNDRDFQVGDTLHLREFTKEEGYGKRSIWCEIGYILSNYAGLEKEYVILSLWKITTAKPVKEISCTE